MILWGKLYFLHNPLTKILLFFVILLENRAFSHNLLMEIANLLLLFDGNIIFSPWSSDRNLIFSAFYDKNSVFFPPWSFDHFFRFCLIFWRNLLNLAWFVLIFLLCFIHFYYLTPSSLIKTPSNFNAYLHQP